MNGGAVALVVFLCLIGGVFFLAWLLFFSDPWFYRRALEANGGSAYRLIEREGVFAIQSLRRDGDWQLDVGLGVWPSRAQALHSLSKVRKQECARRVPWTVVPRNQEQ